MKLPCSWPKLKQLVTITFCVFFWTAHTKNPGELEIRETSSEMAELVSEWVCGVACKGQPKLCKSYWAITSPLFLFSFLSWQPLRGHAANLHVWSNIFTLPPSWRWPSSDQTGVQMIRLTPSSSTHSCRRMRRSKTDGPQVWASNKAVPLDPHHPPNSLLSYFPLTCTYTVCLFGQQWYSFLTVEQQWNMRWGQHSCQCLGVRIGFPPVLRFPIQHTTGKSQLKVKNGRKSANYQTSRKSNL